MSSSPVRGSWRGLRLFQLLQLIAPEGSSLDAVFGSYSDWHKFRPEVRSRYAEAYCPLPPAPKNNAS